MCESVHRSLSTVRKEPARTATVRPTLSASRVDPAAGGLRCRCGRMRLATTPTTRYWSDTKRCVARAIRQPPSSLASTRQPTPSTPTRTREHLHRRRADGSGAGPRPHDRWRKAADAVCSGLMGRQRAERPPTSPAVVGVAVEVPARRKCRSAAAFGCTAGRPRSARTCGVIARSGLVRLPGRAPTATRAAPPLPRSSRGGPPAR